MGTEILKSFGSLQSELEQAKSSLKGVDENIKRLIGRDPSELPPRPGINKRMPPSDDKGRTGIKNINRIRNFIHENDEPPTKRRNSNISVFKRLSDRPVNNDFINYGVQKQLISKVIVTPKEIPSREEALEAQNKDEKFRARNRRMFGALLGTLQKFQQEETKLKPREQKRAQLEKKIEEHEIKEKEEIKKERQELFLNRKKKQAEIKIIELKMLRMKEYAAWEERQKPRGNFIISQAKPHIHFLPRQLTDKTRELLEASKAEVEAIIEKKRQQIFDELKHIENRMRRNFDQKFGQKEEVEDNTQENEEKMESEEPDETVQVEESVPHIDERNDEDGTNGIIEENVVCEQDPLETIDSDKKVSDETTEQHYNTNPGPVPEEVLENESVQMETVENTSMNV